MKEDWLDDQLVFGKVDPSTPVTYSQTCSFDSHLEHLSPPAILPTTSLNSSRNSLATSFLESDTSYQLHSNHQRASESGSKSRKISEKIKSQSLKQLNTWNQVGRTLKFSGDWFCKDFDILYVSEKWKVFKKRVHVFL